MTGWRLPDGTWKDGGELDGTGCGVAFKQREHLKPCLFDLSNDEREMHDLSSNMPVIVEEMWAELNRSALTAYLSRSPDSLKGTCNKTCADAYWEAMYGGRINGPICGVPGCTSGNEVSVLI